MDSTVAPTMRGHALIERVRCCASLVVIGLWSVQFPAGAAPADAAPSASASTPAAVTPAPSSRTAPNAATGAAVTGATSPTTTPPAGGAMPAIFAANAASQPSDTRTYRITLAELGARGGMSLRGLNGIQGVDFGVRQGEQVVAAKLELNYTYSPSLLPDLSQLNVLVNGQFAASIGLTKQRAATPKDRQVDLPLSPFQNFNHMDLQLIGHDTMECEDPSDPALWANVAPQSALVLTVAPKALPDDLSLLPSPFFDSRDTRVLTLPVVLPRSPSNERLVSAGIVSSWFGELAGYRGAHFPVDLGELPKQGNAVVLLLPQDAPAGLSLPTVSGPTVAMVSNPNDPDSKLLLVLGRNEQELRQAATTLALGAQTLTGPVANITSPTVPQPRKPYDAPDWLPHNRPVSFGELLPANSFTVYGHQPGPMNLNLRLPPGLFDWHDVGVPVNLFYQYTQPFTKDSSHLDVLAGSRPVRRLDLLPATDGQVVRNAVGLPAVPAHARINVPTYLLPPLATLQFYFGYPYSSTGACGSAYDTVQSAIDPHSTIDISGFPLYAPMPDLEAFSEAGFPFTRMADLSQTAVILPDAPAATDYSAYLDLLGMMGGAAGYPSVGVTVLNAADIKHVQDKDLLVLDSGGNQPLLKTWDVELPTHIPDQALPTHWWQRLGRRLHLVPVETKSVTLASVSATASQGTLIGLESPLSSGRSVVVVSGSDPSGLSAVLLALQNDHYLDNRIHGSVVAVQGARVVTLSSDQTYYIGHLPFWMALQWFFSNHMWLLLVALFAGAALIAILASISLRARARRRLGA